MTWLSKNSATINVIILLKEFQGKIQQTRVKYHLRASAITASWDRSNKMFDTCNRKLFQCKRCYSACFLCASKPANFFSLWLITLLSEKTTLVSSCVREERGPPAKVRSVELVLSSFLIRSFNVLFFRLLTEILHHLPIGLTF